jgi:hypothetical protein
VIQELANYDPLRYERILRTRLREGLDAFILKVQDRAVRALEHQQSLYVAGGLKKAPKVPDILKPRK